jgi:hypothetical protein
MSTSKIIIYKTNFCSLLTYFSKLQRYKLQSSKKNWLAPSPSDKNESQLILWSRCLVIFLYIRYPQFGRYIKGFSGNGQYYSHDVRYGNKQFIREKGVGTY